MNFPGGGRDAIAIRSNLDFENHNPRGCSNFYRTLVCIEHLQSQGRNMAREMASRNLPEELEVKIVAMMCFPSIFKARLLSKSWHSRFQSVQLQNLHEERTRAISFQKQVTESSNRWGTFCYAYSPAADSLICFDQTLRTRQRLPSLYFLPRTSFQAFAEKYYARLNIGGEFVKPGKPYLQIEGPLLYGMLETNQELYVANILTQEYKKLPARHNFEGEIICGVKLVLETSAQTYKLILIFETNCTLFGECIVQIYDSGANNWSIQKSTDLSRLNFLRPFSISAYFNGVLYMSISDDVESFLAYNLNKRRFRIIRFSNLMGLPGYRLSNAIQSRLVVCDGSLVMIVIGVVSGYEDLQSESDEELSAEDEALQCYTVRVLEVDIAESGPGMEVLFRLAVNRFTDVPVSQDDHKFFGMSKLPRLVLAYDECTKKWSCCYPKKAYRFSSISFQPGLYTFMAV